MQALYQVQFEEQSLDDLLQQFVQDKDYPHVDQDYFRLLLGKGLLHRDRLDEVIGRCGEIPAAQLDPVEHAVLWVALVELRDCIDVPSRVVLNEAIELTKQFGAEGGHRYVNAVLDRAVIETRSAAS